MKNIVLAASLAAFAGFGQVASAGSLSDTVIIEDVTASSAGEVQVMLLIIMLSVAVASN